MWLVLLVKWYCTRIYFYFTSFYLQESKCFSLSYALHKKWESLLRISFVNVTKSADLITFTEETLMENLICALMVIVVFHKMFSNILFYLASAASSKRSDFFNWSNMLLSTNGFLRTISTVSGKDINQFLDKWMYLFRISELSELSLETNFFILDT